MTFPGLRDEDVPRSAGAPGAAAPPPPPVAPEYDRTVVGSAAGAPPSDAAPPPGYPPPGYQAPPRRAPAAGPGRATSILIGVAVVAGVVFLILLLDRIGGSGSSDPPAVPTASPASFALDDGAVTTTITLDGVADGDVATLVVGEATVATATGPSPVTLTWPESPSGAVAGELRVEGDGGTAVVPVSFEVPPAAPGAEAFGQWAMALASYTDQAQAETFAETLADAVPGARVLRSDDWASFRDGFFVVYDAPFATADAVVARCAELGRSMPNECFGRLVSTDAADLEVTTGN